MKLTIRYFGGIRERLGRELEEVEVETAAAGAASPTVEDLWRALGEAHPELVEMRGFVRVAVNRDFADDTTALNPQDEIALIPPVSGGADLPENSSEELSECSDPTGAFRMTRAPLDSDAVREHVVRSEAGAVVVFEGVVRDHTGSRAVSYLEYETYLEMALDKLVECAGEVESRWSAVQIAIHHRWGRLEIGEKAVVIAVSSAHRADAFEACQFAIDRLKEIVPIWKKEVGPDGDQWVGMGA
jgi:molybdopterin synthase catalytic subunit